MVLSRSLEGATRDIQIQKPYRDDGSDPGLLALADIPVGGAEGRERCKEKLQSATPKWGLGSGHPPVADQAMTVPRVKAPMLAAAAERNCADFLTFAFLASEWSGGGFSTGCFSG